MTQQLEYRVVCYDRADNALSSRYANSLREAHDLAFQLQLTNPSVSIFNRRGQWLAEFCIGGIPSDHTEENASA